MIQKYAQKIVAKEQARKSLRALETTQEREADLIERLHNVVLLSPIMIIGFILVICGAYFHLFLPAFSNQLYFFYIIIPNASFFIGISLIFTSLFWLLVISFKKQIRLYNTLRQRYIEKYASEPKISKFDFIN